MITDLNLLVSYAFQWLSLITTMYFSGGILSVCFAIFVIKKVSRLLDIIY